MLHDTNPKAVQRSCLLKAADADKNKGNHDGGLSKIADYGELAPSKGENSARLLRLC